MNSPKDVRHLPRLDRTALTDLLWRAAAATGVSRDGGAIDYGIRLMHHTAAARRAVASGVPGAEERWEAIIGRVAREAGFNFDLNSYAQAGAKVKLAAQAGGKVSAGRRRAKANALAVKLAAAYTERRGTSRLSDSALMAAVGKDFGVSRSTAIANIKRVLENVQ